MSPPPGLIKFKDFLTLLPHVDLYLRQVSPQTYASVLAEIKRREIYNLIVDTDTRHLPLLLRSLLQLQMHEYKYHYLFASFDLETFDDLEDFKYNFVNVTAFRLIDNDDLGVRETLKDMRQFYLRENFKSNFLRHKGRMIEVKKSGGKTKKQNSLFKQKIFFSGGIRDYVRRSLCLRDWPADAGPVAPRAALEYVVPGGGGGGVAGRTEPHQLHELGELLCN